MGSFSKICITALAAGYVGVQASSAMAPHEARELNLNNIVNTIKEKVPENVDLDDVKEKVEGIKIPENIDIDDVKDKVNDIKDELKDKVDDVKNKIDLPAGALKGTAEQLVKLITNAIATGDLSDLKAKIKMVIPLIQTPLAKEVLQTKIEGLVAKLPAGLPKKEIEARIVKLADVLLSELPKADFEKKLNSLTKVFAKLPKKPVTTAVAERRNVQKRDAPAITVSSTVPSSTPVAPQNGTNGTNPTHNTPSPPSPSASNPPNAAAGVSPVMQTMGAFIVGSLFAVFVL